MEGYYYHKRSHRFEVRRDPAPVSPITWGHDASSWLYQQWVRREVYVVKLQQFRVDTPHNDPTHAVNARWETILLTRNVYLTRGNDKYGIEPYSVHDAFGNSYV